MDGQLIMTVGHGNSAFNEVEGRLQANGVTMIVDVRSAPYSRHAPDFTKQALVEFAAVAGLGYRWMGDRLGGRPTADGEMRPDGTPDWDHITRSPAFSAALDELSALARGSRVAVLCSESDPARCHRATVLAPRLEQLGFEVHHIGLDGSSTRHQPTLFPPA